MLQSTTRFQLYMRDHLPLYVFVSVLFVMGIVFGALMVNALTMEQKQDVTRYLGSFFHTIDQGIALDTRLTFYQMLGLHLKWVLLIWVLGLSVIGLPLILMLDFLKGVLVGFTVGYLTGQFSWHGMLFALVSVAPQNVIIIPALIVISVSAVSFSIYLLKNRLLQRKGTITQPFKFYSFTALLVSTVMVAVSLFESYITPSLMKSIAPLLIGLVS